MLTFFLAALMAAAPANPKPGGNEGRDFVALLNQGKWTQAEAMLDATMTGALGGGKLEGLWAQVTGKLGAFQKIERVDVDEVQGFRRDTVVCAFASERAGLRVVVDKQGKVAGFFIVPPTDASPAASAWKSAPYSDPSKFSETPVTVGALKLQGALVVPKGVAKFPIVVMLAGSGPNDMDESVSGIKVFRDLAEGLGTHGIASLRFEKRTHQHQHVVTVKEEYLDDAAAAIDQAAAVPGVTKVILLGHSLGAAMAPRVAQGNAKVAGLVLLAGPTFPYAKAIVAQLEYQKKLGYGGAKIDELLASAREEAKKIDDPALKPETPMGHGATGAYFLDLRSYDAVATLGQLKLPTFLGWGDKDLKVIPDDWAGWKAKLGDRPNLTYKTYPGLQHLFTPVGTADVEHVSKDVITDLVAWTHK
ncbi:MAG: alpha/beta fold hydrolase [Deltaproteobacteria bacterium]|nr:alpha/beta fold hydrolase [Deltaproteobacteria bacterium]